MGNSMSNHTTVSNQKMDRSFKKKKKSLLFITAIHHIKACSGKTLKFSYEYKK